MGLPGFNFLCGPLRVEAHETIIRARTNNKANLRADINWRNTDFRFMRKFKITKILFPNFDLRTSFIRHIG